MLKTDVFNIEGNKVGEMELDEAVFGVEVNEALVHEAVVNQMANGRQGTKGTLTRAEVSGGGRKPWSQKGTGRARQGSIRSPQWKGGGVVFAPKMRDFSFGMNKKQKRQALKSALTSRVNDNKMIVLNELVLNNAKTKEMQTILNNLKVNKALVVFDREQATAKNIMLASRNIQGVKTAGINTINVYDILKYDNFVVTKEAVEKIQEVYR
ncbi:MAG: 50S ribosomal protein L4 [Clostridia bacterium]|nr:50S ribosomal protein L4 [Clostridia bacterium]